MLTHGVSHKGTYADWCAYFWNLVEAVVEMRIDRDGAMVLYATLCDIKPYWPKSEDEADDEA